MFALTLLALSSATYIVLTRRFQRTNVAARHRDFGQKGRFGSLAFLAVSRSDLAAPGRVWYRRIQNFLANSRMQSSKTGLKRPVHLVGGREAYRTELYIHTVHTAQTYSACSMSCLG